jgi:CubicO group peptidase (beta-lactamase class C family)
VIAALFAAGALSVVDAAAAQMHFRGVVRVERAGSLLVEKGYGEPADTAFWVASISKSFTAALIVRLAEEGKLTLHDQIGDVTIDELLTHTSGLPRSTYLAEGITDPEEAQRKILAQPRGPKGKFAYTNDGYSLLAIAAQRAGGAPFFELMQKKILDRAGLKHTGFWPKCFRGAHAAKLARPPQGVRAGADWGFKGPDGICSTAEDLARFIHAIDQGTLPGKSVLWGDPPRGFFRTDDTIWTRGTEDYGHNGVVKWIARDQVLIVVLSDVPEPKADTPAPSRALGDALETKLSELR